MFPGVLSVCVYECDERNDRFIEIYTKDEKDESWLPLWTGHGTLYIYIYFFLSYIVLGNLIHIWGWKIYRTLIKFKNLFEHLSYMTCQKRNPIPLTTGRWTFIWTITVWRIDDRKKHLVPKFTHPLPSVMQQWLLYLNLFT